MPFHARQLSLTLKLERVQRYLGWNQYLAEPARFLLYPEELVFLEFKIKGRLSVIVVTVAEEPENYVIRFANQHQFRSFV